MDNPSRGIRPKRNAKFRYNDSLKKLKNKQHNPPSSHIPDSNAKFKKAINNLRENMAKISKEFKNEDTAPRYNTMKSYEMSNDIKKNSLSVPKYHILKEEPKIASSTILKRKEDIRPHNFFHSVKRTNRYLNTPRTTLNNISGIKDTDDLELGLGETYQPYRQSLNRTAYRNYDRPSYKAMLSSKNLGSRLDKSFNKKNSSGIFNDTSNVTMITSANETTSKSSEVMTLNRILQKQNKELRLRTQDTRNKITELMNKIKILRMENINLSSENKKLTIKITSLENELDYNKNISLNELEVKSNQITQLNNEIIRLNSIINDKNTEIMNITSTNPNDILNTTNKLYNTFHENDINELDDNIDDNPNNQMMANPMNHSMMLSQNNRRQINQFNQPNQPNIDINALIKQIDALKKQINNMKYESQMKGQNKIDNNKYNNLLKENERIKSFYNDLTERFDKLKKHCQEIEIQNKNYENMGDIQNMGDLNSELNTLKEENQMLKNIIYQTNEEGGDPNMNNFNNNNNNALKGSNNNNNNQNIQQLNLHLNQLNNENQTLKEKIKSLENRLKQNNMNNMNNNSNNMNNNYFNSQNLNNSNVNNNNEMTINELKNIINGKINEINELNDKIQKDEEELNENKNKAEQLSNRNAELENENLLNQQQIIELNNIINDLNQKINDLENEQFYHNNNDMNDPLNNNNNLQDNDNEKAELQQQIMMLQNQIQEMQLNNMNNMNMNNPDSNNETNNTIQQMIKDKQDLINENSDLQKQIISLKNDIYSLQNHISELENNPDHDNQNENYGNDSYRIHDLERQLKEAKMKNDSNFQELKAKQKESQDLLNVISNKDKEMSKLKTLIEQLKSGANNNNNNNNYYNNYDDGNNIGQLHPDEEIESLYNEIENLKKEIDSKNEQIEQKEREIENYKSINNKLVQDNNNMKEKVKLYEEGQDESLIATVENLKDELKEKKIQIEKLINENELLRNKNNRSDKNLNRIKFGLEENPFKQVAGRKTENDPFRHTVNSSGINDAEKVQLYKEQLNEYKINHESDLEQIKMLKEEIKEIKIRMKNFQTFNGQVREFNDFLIILNTTLTGYKPKKKEQKEALAKLNQIISAIV